MADREVAITNPDKVFFPKTGYTKKSLVLYYMTVAEGALRGTRGRPMLLKRFPDAAEIHAELAAVDAAEQRRRPPSGQQDEPLEVRLQSPRSQCFAERAAARDSSANEVAIAIARESPAVAGEQDADLLEQLAHRGGCDRVSPFEILGVDGAARKHVRAGGEIGAARPLHEQQLPRFLAANEQHGRRRSRRDGRAFEVQGA